MAFSKRIFRMTMMGVIFGFALIHLGVSIGIIIPTRQYGDIYRPQLGLASFNLVIVILALVTGGLGLFSIFQGSGLIGTFFLNDK